MKKLLLLLVAFFCMFQIWGSHAYPVMLNVTQTDGKALSLVKNGDESFHYYMTLDGVAVCKNSEAQWCYAQLENNIQTATEVLAHNQSDRSTEEKAFADSVRSAFNRDNKFLGAFQRYGIGLKASAPVNSIGEVHIPVILVQFSDLKMQAGNDSTFFSNHFNAENYTEEGGSGSVCEYFKAQSNGLFQPVFHVIGPVTLSHNKAYYGGNNNKGNDKNDQTMMNEAIDCATASGYDFSVLGKGTSIPCVGFVYAGYGEQSSEDKDAIWAKYIYWIEHKSGGYTFGTGFCVNEIADYDGEGDKADGIGTFCHEFSHTLGLPDFYNTNDYSDVFGMDYWSIMDMGQYVSSARCPVGYSSYEREYMGWLKVETLETKKQVVTLSSLAGTEGHRAYKILNDADATGNEYLLLENRTESPWYSNYYGEGMLVLHVDYDRYSWTGNTLNNERKHQRMTVIPADGVLTRYVLQKAGGYIWAEQKDYLGDLYPGCTNNTSLTNETSPADAAYTGSFFNKKINQIKQLGDGSIQFVYMAEGILETPTLFQADNVETSSFSVSWAAVTNAENYLLTLMSGSDTVTVDTVSTTSDVFSNLLAEKEYSVKLQAIAADYVDSESADLKVSTKPSTIQSVKEEWGNDAVQVYTADGRYWGTQILNQWKTPQNLKNNVLIFRKGSQSRKVTLKE